MSVSVTSVTNESSSDGCGPWGTSFCNGGAASRSHCIPTVACSGGFSVSVVAYAVCIILNC